MTTARVLVDVLPCRVDARLRVTRAALDQLGERFGAMVLPAVRSRTRVGEAAAARAPVVELDPDGAGADYRTAAELIERRMHGAQAG